MTPKLKPCPFCGQENPILKTIKLDRGFSGAVIPYTLIIVSIKCTNKECDVFFHSASTEENIIARWNRRINEL